MDRKEKIKVIYEKIANTDVTLGCRTKIWIIRDVIADHDNWIMSFWFITKWKLKYYDSEWFYAEDKIIWHPVMIWDVLEYDKQLNLQLMLDWKDPIDTSNILNIWNDFRKPIEDQSDECVDYVYSLLD